MGTDSLEKRFTLDYWGVSFRQALEYLLKNNNGELFISTDIANDEPGNYNLQILKKEQRERIKFVEPAQSKFLITTFTQSPIKDPLHEDEYYSIKTDNTKITTIYNINQEKIKAGENTQSENKGKIKDFFDFVEKKNPALARELKEMQNLPVNLRKEKFEEIKKKYPGFFR
jgi:hypothetical protein